MSKSVQENIAVGVIAAYVTIYDKVIKARENGP